MKTPPPFISPSLLHPTLASSSPPLLHANQRPQQLLAVEGFNSPPKVAIPDPLAYPARSWWSPEPLERCHTPGRSASDYESTREESPLFEPESPMLNNTAPSREPHEGTPMDDHGIRDFGAGEEKKVDESALEHDYPPPQQHHPDQNVDCDRNGSVAPPVDTRIRRESSDDDVPLRNRRAARDPYGYSSDTIVVRRERPTQESNNCSSDTMRDRPRLRESIKELAKKPHKKPGPKPWSTKPIMKNDMDAKMEVIREIEDLWGKGFIKAYIPKCHRPLVKKRKGGKRTIYREHETNPKNWLPSVLKAILMIARITDDKLWLKKAMGEVVRYRIKNTGNRKPQLVTTDFDVIEDMLTRNWECAESFEIRYKHLLMAQPKEERQTDEDVEHILGAGRSGSDKDSDDEEASRKESDDDMDEDMTGLDEDEEDFGKYVAKQELSDGYMQKSGYVQNAPHYPPKAIVPAKPSKQAKSSVKQPGPAKKPPYPQMFGYGSYSPYPGYGSPMNGYGPPMPGFPPHMKGFHPHLWGYNPYGGYGQQNPGKDARNPGQPGLYGYPGMPPFHPHQPMTLSPSMASSDLRGYPANANNDRSGFDHGDDVSNPDRRDDHFSPFRHSKHGSRAPVGEEAPARMYGMGMGGMGIKTPSEPLSPRMVDVEPRVKREPGVEDRPITIEDFDGPTNYLQGGQSEEPDEDADEATRLELEEAEAQHKLLQLRKKLAMTKAKKNSC
ncbi:hypothetical protein K458DRAFT_410972 [Lentithecium fluviatile CBS 122367]|uniref:Uncharacterized protein n=1 Tax=Lentithecium fluviatile CBS 122367 TaxID=1168545 RepID=A0A6G1ICB5_9PLEO|nr:hypothetical protein K458DRAFT_410972 [Lentithecium fluviatile CBS 122367]